MRRLCELCMILVDQVNALAGVPDEESIAVIQPGGDQGVKQCHTLVRWLAASHWSHIEMIPTSDDH